MKEASMQQYRQKPGTVSAAKNEFNETRMMQDSQDMAFPVPAGWWLVESAPGFVSVVMDGVFQGGFEKAETFTPLESFVNTLGDLRETDRMAVQRAMDLEVRIAALEAKAQSIITCLLYTSDAADD